MGKQSSYMTLIRVNSTLHLVHLNSCHVTCVCVCVCVCTLYVHMHVPVCVCVCVFVNLCCVIILYLFGSFSLKSSPVGQSLSFNSLGSLLVGSVSLTAQGDRESMLNLIIRQAYSDRGTSKDC